MEKLTNRASVTPTPGGAGSRGISSNGIDQALQENYGLSTKRVNSLAPGQIGNHPKISFSISSYWQSMFLVKIINCDRGPIS